MLAIELLVEEILRLQNLTMFLRAQLQEARNMSDAKGPNMSRAWLDDIGARLDAIVGQERKMNAQELIGRMCASPLVIRYEDCDPIIHTNDLPWCDDMNCPCHYDFTVAGEAEYQAIIEQPLADGLLTEPEAARIYDGKQV